MRRTNFALMLATATLALAGCKEAGTKDNPADALPKVAAPAGAAWSATVTKTEEGYVMGNPDAALKLVEYGSLVCGHCADFSNTGKEGLKKLVDSGQVSYEFRNFILGSAGPVDAMAAAITHCAPADRYFAITENFFASQRDIFAKLQQTDQAAANAAQALPPEQRFVALAKAVGLTDWFMARGMPEAAINACLAKPENLKKREDITTAAAKTHNVQGTPHFILNGENVEAGNTWPVIEELLKNKGARPAG